MHFAQCYDSFEGGKKPSQGLLRATGCLDLGLGLPCPLEAATIRMSFFIAKASIGGDVTGDLHSGHSYLGSAGKDCLRALIDRGSVARLGYAAR